MAGAASRKVEEGAACLWWERGQPEIGGGAARWEKGEPEVGGGFSHIAAPSSITD